MLKTVISALVLIAAAAAFGEDGYLFSYFSERGHDGRRGEAAGLHLAWSFDGLEWTAFNDDHPVLVPELGHDRLMRDPSLCRGPDGTFHLVWTIDWKGGAFGYASSKDLVHWSKQREINLMTEEPLPRNCWAPEVTYNPEDGLFYVYWSSTVPGRHSPIPEMENKENGLNHRIYLSTTRDFETFSPVCLWFNPDYSAIDATLVRDEVKGDWLFFVKNENHTPVKKDIRMMRIKSLDGVLPAETGRPITRHWTEGPSALFVGDKLYLYFDNYREHRYGLLASDDRGETWTDLSGRLSMPDRIRHGTALKVDREFIYKLLRAKWTPSKAAEKSSTPELSLSALTMGAEKLVKYGEKVRIEGELTYLVSEGSDFLLTMDENGELKVVGVPGWWSPQRVTIAFVIIFLLFAAVLGWAFLLRHQKLSQRRVGEAVQKERLRLSHDLHDGYQQLLAGCMFRLTAAKSLLSRGNVERAEMQLDGMHTSLTHAQNELRAALWTMKEEAEGPSAMAELFRYAASRLPQWEGKVTFEAVGEERQVSRRYAGALLMILQEAVGNALKHGKATAVKVKTVFGRHGFAMLVSDDGCGFDTTRPIGDVGVHLGLDSMRSRAANIGGRCVVRSSVGHGTTVKIVVEEKE